MQETEPSVLDYVKSLLPWSRRSIEIPSPVAVSESAVVERASAEVSAEAVSAMPWRSLLALSSALLAQIFLEPPQTAAPLGVAFYVLALALLLWAALGDEWSLAPQAESLAGNDPLTVRWLPFVVSAVLLVPVFILLGGAVVTPGLELPGGLVLSLIHI